MSGSTKGRATLEDYHEVRAHQARLNQEVLRAATSRDDIVLAADALGVRTGRRIDFRDEQESRAFADFLLHEEFGGPSAMTRHLRTMRADRARDREFVAAAAKSSTSLYRVLRTEVATGRVWLVDEVARGERQTIVDVPLSQSALKGTLLFLRSISFPGFAMTSGASFVFPPLASGWLAKAWTARAKRVKLKELGRERYVYFFKMNRLQGAPIEPLWP